MKVTLATLVAFLETVYVSANPLALIPRDSASSSLICGQAGYDAGTESYYGTSGSSYSTCLTQCNQQTGCKGFAYGSGDCQLYDVSVQSNFVADGGSPYLFYDSRCATSTTSTKGATGTVKTSTTTPKVTTATTASTTKAATTTKIASINSAGTAKTTTTSSSATSATSQICGQQGNNVGAQSFFYGGYVEIGGCENACANYSCTSFAYGAGECYLYNVSASSGFVASDDSWYALYDASCFNLTYTPPLDPSKICGNPCYYPDDHTDLNWYSTWYQDPTPDALADCYQRCITYEDGYCLSWMWGKGECQIWAELPTPYDDGWHPMMSNYCYARVCGAPGASASSSVSTTTSKKTTTSTKSATTTATAKGTSSTSKKAVTTTTSSKVSTLPSSTGTTTKASAATTKSTATTSTKTTALGSSKASSVSSTTPKPITSATKVSRTTSKTSKTTSNTQTPSSTALCGLPGYENSPNFMTTSDGDNYNDCLAGCKAQPNCKAFSFATSNNECNLYDVSASQASKYNTISPYHFYDADCTTAYKVCGVAGWDFQFQAYWDGWTGYTADSCASTCIADKACRSFSSGNGECHLYDVPVTGNINAQPASPYKFSDATCIAGTS